MDIYDTDGDGKMSREEAEQKMAIKSAFAKYDVDQSGWLSMEELTKLVAEVDEEGKISKAELKKGLSLLDKDGNGQVEEEEFVEWWTYQGESGGSDSLRGKMASIVKVLKKQHATDIHIASWYGDETLVQQFLDENAGLVNARDETQFGDAYTPLHYAAYQGNTSLCQ